MGGWINGPALFWHRFEFPEEIDMYKYTVTGLEEREAREAAASGDPEEEGPPSTSTASAKSPEECKYYLKGIVVHSGTAFAGHYYSYIKVIGSARASPWKLPVSLGHGMTAKSMCYLDRLEVLGLL
jgi:hypothetical protein